MSRRVVVELEWTVEIPDDADVTEAVGDVMEAHGDRPFRDVLCEMYYVRAREKEPWETQGF